MHEVIIPGPEGRMEGRYNKGKGRNPPLVILLHPHPMHGGFAASGLVDIVGGLSGVNCFCIILVWDSFS